MTEPTNTTPEGLAERLAIFIRRKTRGAGYVAALSAAYGNHPDKSFEEAEALFVADLQALRTSEEQRDRMRGALEEARYLLSFPGKTDPIDGRSWQQQASDAANQITEALSLHQEKAK